MSANSINIAPASVPGQQTDYDHAFPLVLECSTPGVTLADSTDWARANRDELLQKAGEHGAILFRGLPLNTPEDCDAFVAAFGLTNFPYNESLSNAVRVNWTERIFSANEAPADVTIYFHHEMAQTPIFPAKLFFFCQTAGGGGGRNAALPVGRSVRAARRALPEVRARLRRKRPAVFERDAGRQRSEIGHGPKLEEHAPRRDPRGSGSAATRHRLRLGVAARRVPAGDDARAAGGS